MYQRSLNIFSSTSWSKKNRSNAGIVKLKKVHCIMQNTNLYLWPKFIPCTVLCSQIFHPFAALSFASVSTYPMPPFSSFLKFCTFLHATSYLNHKKKELIPLQFLLYNFMARTIPKLFFSATTFIYNALMLHTSATSATYSAQVWRTESSHGFHGDYSSGPCHCHLLVVPLYQLR